MLQHYLSILVILNTAKIHEALEHCSASTYSVYGHRLSSHVISTGISSSLSDCVIMCQNEFRCKSLNFRLRDKSCDLNDADRYTHPEDYGPQEGSVYMDTSVKPKVEGYICLFIISISNSNWSEWSTIQGVIVSITKFSIVIGSPRAYFSRNQRAITWMSDLNFL